MGRPTLHSSILRGDIEAVKKLLRSYKINVNKKDDNERTPLHFAALKGNEKAIKLLKMRGANPNIEDCHGSIPLHLAAKHNNPEAVKLLIDMGSELNVQDRYGNTPLHLAAYKGNVRVAEELLASGINPNIINVSWMTALANTVKSKNMRIYEVIKRAGGKSPKTIRETFKLAYLSSNVFRKYGVVLFSTVITGFALFATIHTKGELSDLLISAILASLGFAIVCLAKPYKRVRNLEAQILNNNSTHIEIEDLLFSKSADKNQLTNYSMIETTSLNATNDNDKTKRLREATKRITKRRV